VCAFAALAKWLSFIYYALGILLFLQLGGRTFYSCTTADANLGCAQVSPPGDLATNPLCHPVQE
jgi:hypothetical protein